MGLSGTASTMSLDIKECLVLGIDSRLNVQVRGDAGAVAYCDCHH